MKKFLILYASIAFVLTFASCTESAPKQEDTKKVAEEHNDAKFNAAKETDAQFMVNAAEINLEEIKLGELAATSGMAADVKKLGTMMKTEHAKALKDLQGLATTKQITIPGSITDDGQAAYTKLMAKKGKDFDKDYSDMMVDGHKKAIEKFEKATTNVTDPEIKAWATSMLPALRMHLDASMACQKMHAKM